MRFSEKRAKNDEKLQFMIWDSRTPQVFFAKKKERAGGAIPQIKSAKMHRAVKISQLINQFYFWYRKT